MVFYLKYRPQNVNELDSNRVRESLYSVLSLPEIPHAFLFTGPKGLGKTSAARILAKAINCERKSQVSSNQQVQGKQVPHVLQEEVSKKTRDTRGTRATRGTFQVEPCNTCDICKSITNGTSVDILEIDAASNRGIDEIRDLREKIRLVPAVARKKVYIIDEVHMLTTEAFNALLKTLEEPPSHAVFILCTTELHKVPSTITSRCFHIPFTPASAADIARSFRRISDGEGITIDEAVITQITELAEGGFRDAHKILEELTASGEKSITSELLDKQYHISDSKRLIKQLIGSFSVGDAKAGLMVIQEAFLNGLDMKLFLTHSIRTLHQEFLTKAGVDSKDSLRNQNSQLTVQELRDVLVLLNSAYTDMKFAVLPQIPLELAVIQWESVKQNTGKDAETVVQEVTVSQKTTAVTNNAHTVSVTSMRKQAGELARVRALYGEKPEIKPIQQENKADVSLLNVSNAVITEEWLQNFWRVFILEMKQYNHTIAGVLRSCNIAKFDKKSLIIETAYAFHLERLSEGKTRMILEQVCKTLTGNPVSVIVLLKK